MLIKGWSSSFQILDRSVDGHDVDFSFRPCIFAIIQRHIGCRFYAPPASYCPERLGSPLVELIEVSARWPRMESWGGEGGGGVCKWRRIGQMFSSFFREEGMLRSGSRRRWLEAWMENVSQESRFVENSEKFCYFCLDVVGDMSCSSREFSTLLEFNFWQ